MLSDEQHEQVLRDLEEFTKENSKVRIGLRVKTHRSFLAVEIIKAMAEPAACLWLLTLPTPISWWLPLAIITPFFAITVVNKKFWKLRINLREDLDNIVIKRGLYPKTTTYVKLNNISMIRDTPDFPGQRYGTMEIVADEKIELRGMPWPIDVRDAVFDLERQAEKMKTKETSDSRRY